MVVRARIYKQFKFCSQMTLDVLSVLTSLATVSGNASFAEKRYTESALFRITSAAILSLPS